MAAGKKKGAPETGAPLRVRRDRTRFAFFVL